MSYETQFDEDGRAEVVYVKEEPDCGPCGDSSNQPVWGTCPECNPSSPEQVAAYWAAYNARAASYPVVDEAPF